MGCGSGAILGLQIISCNQLFSFLFSNDLMRNLRKESLNSTVLKSELSPKWVIWYNFSIKHQLTLCTNDSYCLENKVFVKFSFVVIYVKRQVLGKITKIALHRRKSDKNRKFHIFRWTVRPMFLQGLVSCITHVVPLRLTIEHVKESPFHILNTFSL